MIDEKQRGIRACIQIHPGDDSRIFRLGAADDILRVLIDAHDTEFTLKELGRETDYSRSTVWRALELLTKLGIIQIRETTQRKYVSIDTEHIQKSEPILTIEQPEYHQPVRTYVQRIQDALGDTDEVQDIIGVLVFGSVARGEADRKSDIDLFVLVEGDRTVARRIVTEVAAELGDEQFDGDRYEFESYVESVESARRAGTKLREIFREGITVHGGNEFQQVKKAVLADER
ncbi:nucleotidyltransferase domain-containing protein [Haladaptatus pallidirubidus]|uniref:HTH domain-containing protein n=1 Tax=Haladaptatus pallidirubidus TaxID=1008152 RepID=A0AAV3UJ06_9EURY|nr:nucleotidyltransferase domain-containing protein [Haladaptatus pallidirubidus]